MEQPEEHTRPQERLLISVKEAAHRIGVSHDYYYRMIGAGKVPYKRIGLGRGILRVPIKALEAWSESLDQASD